MAKYCHCFFLTTLLCFMLKIPAVVCATDPLDVAVLDRLYKTLYYAPQLHGWERKGGDPCANSWSGIICNGTQVISIRLSGLNVVGYLSPELYLLNLKKLDLSGNRIKGRIPYFLPPYATHIDLSSNLFSTQIPHSLMFMSNLIYLNISHNTLSGHIDTDFTRLKKLEQMDLSNNFFTGNLPRSFISLTSLSELYLQNNKFDGSIAILAKLPLTSLDVQNNNFSGPDPNGILYVKNLWIGGNEQLDILNNHTGRFNLAVSLVIVVSGLLVALVAVVCRSYNKENQRKYMPVSLESKEANKSNQNLASLSSLELVSRSPHLVCNMATRSDLTKTQQKDLPFARCYTYKELQTATGNFGAGNLLGQGSVGRYFNAKLSGHRYQVLACVVPAKGNEQFLDIVSRISKLRHPNILQLLGYCIEHGQHLVYEHAGTLTLEHELYNNGEFLNWAVRINIAVSLAKALEYLHSRGSPLEHDCDIMAANVLLDKKLEPRFRGCGLAALKPIIRSEQLKGYTDNGQHSLNCLSNDIYSFGGLLLGLVTGKKASDESTCPLLSKENHIKEMVDPALRTTKLLSNILSRTLYEFVSIALRCLEVNPENRPCMEEVVNCLVKLTGREHGK